MSVDNFDFIESFDPRKNNSSKKTRIINSEIFLEKSSSEISTSSLPFWKEVVTTLPTYTFHDLPVFGNFFLSDFDDLKIVFPSLKSPGNLSIGNFTICDTFPGVQISLPTPWNANLDELSRSIQKIAHKFVKSLFRVLEIRANMQNGVPYGRYTIAEPNSTGILNASKETLKQFDDCVRKANLMYVRVVNEAALSASMQTLTTLLQSFDSLFTETLNARKDEFTQLLGSLDKNMIPNKVLQTYWSASILLFRSFGMSIQKALESERQKKLERAVKKTKAKELLAEAQADLMDIDMSAATVKSIVDDRVKTLLAEAISKKSTAKSGSSNARLLPPSSGNDRRAKSPSTRPKGMSKTAPKKTTPMKQEAKKTSKAPSKPKKPDPPNSRSRSASKNRKSNSSNRAGSSGSRAKQ